MAKCHICGEDILDDCEDTYCEDCRDSGDLEEVLDRCLDAIEEDLQNNFPPPAEMPTKESNHD